MCWWYTKQVSLWLIVVVTTISISGVQSQGEDKEVFQNLFRGSRQQTKSNNGGSRSIITIEPMDEEAGEGVENQRGIIKVDHELWSQGEVDLQLLPNHADTPFFKFRQSPEDQPTPNQFYGMLDQENGDRGDTDDYIVLVNSTAMSSKLSVVMGTIRVKGNLYQIQQLPSGQIIVEYRGTDHDFDDEIEIDDDMEDEWLDQAAESSQGANNVEFELPPHRHRQLSMSARDDMSNSSIRLAPHDSFRRLQAEDDGSQLDIMVIYSRSAMCAAARHFNDKCVATSANKATIEGIIDLAISEANEAFSASGIATKLRLVHVHYDDEYDDTAHGWPAVFSHYTGKTDGYLDYIHPMRDQYGADFVSFFVNTRGYCGSAHRPSEPREDRAFSMVRWDCATGHFTFAHEVSHNLGCRHDRENANTAILPGDFNFGYQYNTPENRADRWRTLMSYDCPDGCQRLLRYSNPLLTRQGGVPFGSEKADNARFIRERLKIYANFRASVVPDETPEAQLAPATSEAVVYPKGTNQLETVTTPGSLIGAAGNMFDIVAKKDLKITGFAVTAFAATTFTVEVYKLKEKGTFIGHEYSPGAWTLIGGAIIHAKADRPTSLPPGSISGGVTVRQGEIQAFYVTYKSDRNFNRYSRATELGAVHAQNSDIQFKVGHTVNYPFQYHPTAPRVFNGKIYYEVLPTGSLTTAPTAQPLAAKTVESSNLASKDDIESFLTTFVSNNGHSGNLFTIEATVDMIIDTFDVHSGSTESNMELLIYTKYGDFSRNDGDPSATWTLIANTTVQGQGESEPTNVPSKNVKTVAIKAKTRQSFYITFTGPHIRYTSALIDPSIIRNNHMSFMAGAGTQYPFKHYFPNRIWNGVIYYRVGDDGTANIQGIDTAVESDNGSERGEDDTETGFWSSASVAPRASP